MASVLDAVDDAAADADMINSAWGDQPTHQSWASIWASMVAGDTRVKTINQTIASDRYTIEINKAINTSAVKQLTTATCWGPSLILGTSILFPVVKMISNKTKI